MCLLMSLGLYFLLDIDCCILCMLQGLSVTEVIEGYELAIKKAHDILPSKSVSRANVYRRAFSLSVTFKVFTRLHMQIFVVQFNPFF